MFRPLGDNVLVQRLQAETKIGSLHIPEASQAKAKFGKVVAVGKGKRSLKSVLLPPQVEVGQEICFGAYSGEDIHLGGVEHVIMKEHEILAVVVAGK